MGFLIDIVVIIILLKVWTLYLKLVITINFPLNVCSGIMGNQVIRPIILPNRPNDKQFLNFLENDLDNLLETMQNMHTQNTSVNTNIVILIRKIRDTSWMVLRHIIFVRQERG